MAEVPPSMLAALNRAPGEVGELFRSFFGAFEFDGIEVRMPTRTFEHRLDVEVGGREVQLIEVGPAHTAGDTIAYVPDARTVFTGDILFIGGTPIVWAGPLAQLGGGVRPDARARRRRRWCPATVRSPTRRASWPVRDYLAFVEPRRRARHAAGVDAWDAAREIAALDRRARGVRRAGASSAASR